MLPLPSEKDLCGTISPKEIEGMLPSFGRVEITRMQGVKAVHQLLDNHPNNQWGVM